MPGRLTPPDPRKAGAAMGNERVDQRAVRVARRRMDDEAGGLVHDDQVVVFIGDRERDVLAAGCLVQRRRDVERDRLARFDPVCGLRYRLARNRDPARLDQGLEPRAGERRDGLRQKPVESRAIILPGDVEPVARFGDGAHKRYGP